MADGSGFTISDPFASPPDQPGDPGPQSTDDRSRKPPEDGRPVIQVQAGRLAELATSGEAALRESGLPIFQRGDMLVRPISHELPASHGRTTIAAGLAELGTHAVLDLLSRAARWEVFNKRQKEWVRCDPPTLVASVILSRTGEWTVPRVAGVITTPTMRRDGSLLTAPGYDPATRLYHVADPALRLPSIPARPTRQDAERALEKLKRLLRNFPFVSEVDRAVALSALVTPVVRGALSVVPMHAFRASTAGTGKSYVVDLSSAISTGRPCPVVAAGHTDEETEKRLVGLLLAGFPVVSIDNVNGELGGDLLCQAIERPLVRVRPLGRSEIMEIEGSASLFATGNGLRVRGDMTRRTLIGDLDAGMERPETRTFDFDPVADVLADRGAYVAACLTIAGAYLADGQPGMLPHVASFEDWSGLVRSALVWLGCADPAKSMETARQDDPELTELREVLSLWKEHLGTDALTARDIAEAASRREETCMGVTQEFALPDLRDALLRIAGERGVINTRSLGRWLAAREGRIVAGVKISRADGEAHGGLTRWQLRAV